MVSCSGLQGGLGSVKGIPKRNLGPATAPAGKSRESLVCFWVINKAFDSFSLRSA